MGHSGVFREGENVGLKLAYMVITDSCGPPDTLDRAYSFVGNKVVAFGFPDILFTPDDVFIQLLWKQRAGHADLVLGLFPAHDHRLMDMVRVDDSGRVTELVLKPLQTDLHYAWVCAVWTPTFTEFLHEFVSSDEAQRCRQRLRTPDRPTRGLAGRGSDSGSDPQGIASRRSNLP